MSDADAGQVSGEVLARALRTALREAGDRERAAKQQAYMKSAMPYYGILTPDFRRLINPILAAHAPGNRHAWEAAVRLIWDGATHREERYAALALCEHRRARP